MKEITSFFAAAPEVWSVKVTPFNLTYFACALAVVESAIVQKYELTELNAAEPSRVTALGPFEFGIVNVPVTACCDV